MNYGCGCLFTILQISQKDFERNNLTPLLLQPLQLWLTSFRPELVQTALEMSLRKLQLSYVDLFLIHFPTALKVSKSYFPLVINIKIVAEHQRQYGLQK